MKQKHVLVISYFAGMKGFSPAEWLDDKVDSFVKLGYRITLVSALSSVENKLPGVTHYRVPSLSLTDFKHEKRELKEFGTQMPGYIWCLIPIIYTLGFFIDLLLKAATKGVGGGRLSWAITSTVFSLYLGVVKNIDVVFSTGGAASSHLVAVVVGIFTRKPSVVELQDPLAGEGIGRNSRSAQLLSWVEKCVVRFSKKVVYVTEAAAQESRERYSASNVVCIYPGAKKFEFAPPSLREGKKFRFLHLGTLYSTRNFDTLIQAIDQLIATNKISADQIELVNQGEIYGEYKAYYHSKSYFRQFAMLPRAEAVALSAASDVNLVVQHTDPRSSTTIPYKLYDYMNVGRPILGIINSDELKNVLQQYGHYSANVNDVDQIAERVLFLMNQDLSQPVAVSQIDATKQAEELIIV